MIDPAHHDGSALYVSTQEPGIGDLVTVRMRIDADLPVQAVHVRALRDAEPVFVPAHELAPTAGERWFEATLKVDNTVLSYRFLITLPGSYAWLTGRGWYERDVPDTNDFRITTHPSPPAWSRGAVIYQIFPDRFARSGAHRDAPDWAVPTPWRQTPAVRGDLASQQFYGGDLAGIERHLDDIVRLGATAIYLTPFFPARSSHRYDATTFDHVDPLLGGDEALASLTHAAHAVGLRVVGDLTMNHTGVGHEWFQRALADPTSAEHGFYYFDDTPRGYVGWLDVPSLPKLNYAGDGLLERMTGSPDSVVGRWLREPFNLDGWRLDVANMTGRYGAHDFGREIARAVRARVDAERRDGLVVAEHGHDASAELQGDGWNATMNYSGFLRPLWPWLVPADTDLDFLGLPVCIPRRGGRALVASLRDFAAKLPWDVQTAQWNLLCSHDTPRIRTVTQSDALVEVGAAAMLTLPGTAMIFAGDEIGATGITGEQGRITMPWDHPERWDTPTTAAYRDLIRLHADEPALREGGLRWAFAEDDAVGYLRESADERLLVVLSRGPWAGADLPSWLLAVGESPERLYGDLDINVRPEGLEVSGTGPGVGIWRLA